MGKTWDIQTGVPPYEAAHPYAVRLEKENKELQEKVVLLKEKLATCKRLAQQAEEVSDWEYVFNCLHQIEAHAAPLGE